MAYEQSFLISLLVTLLIEIPIVFFFVYSIYKRKEKFDIIFSGILASVLTLPYFWFILPYYISDRITYIVLGELVVIIIEAFIYFRLLKLKLRQAILISFLANLASTLIGLVVNNQHACKIIEKVIKFIYEIKSRK